MSIQLANSDIIKYIFNVCPHIKSVFGDMEYVYRANGKDTRYHILCKRRFILNFVDLWNSYFQYTTGTVTGKLNKTSVIMSGAQKDIRVLFTFCCTLLFYS